METRDAMHQSSLAEMAGFVDRHLNDRRGAALQILDIGAMDVNGSYRSLFDDPCWRYHGADAVQGPGVDLVLDTPYAWSAIASSSIDVVISGQTLEHVRFPWMTVLEIHRVLRPGGLLCLLVPAGGYQHRYPVDCWRYYPDGVAALATWADLDVLEARTSWTSELEWDDDSAQWMDTLLVARKGTLTGRNRLKNAAKHRVLRAVLRTHAQRQESRVPVLGPSDH